jgi:deoxyribodipyrimidine photo-lyase
MKKTYQTSLFVFRRDLRLDDNPGLQAACLASEAVVPIFIFDPQQVGNSNQYRSNNAVQFMVESLKDLQNQLKKKGGKLYLFYGDAEKLIAHVAKKVKAEAVFFNKDYTPFALKRDKAITSSLKKSSIEVHPFQGLLLTDPEKVVNKSGKPYAVFTPFFKTASATKPRTPEPCRATNFYTKTIAGSEPVSIFNKIAPKDNKEIAVHGGSEQAKKILQKLGNFKNYAKTRDFPELPTTHLSAHLKFGTVSPQQVVAALIKTNSSQDLIRQLYWRDFYTHLAFHFPHVFGKAFNQKYQGVTWSTSKANFEKWCQGKTGFPLVDAGMRQLNKTGWMHNRVRMVVCSFLTKDLHLHWLWGEKYFAQQLVDYDPCVNNGSWQWGASTGADAAPYFRIFNPWSQQKRFDPECTYIKKWLPELKNVDSKEIHNYFKATEPLTPDYPLPMLEHGPAAQKAKDMFKKM